MISGREKIESAIDWLLQDEYWFFGAESLRKKWAEEDSIDTLCTDGTGIIRYNPEYIESINFDNTIYCVVHEDYHDILLHPFIALELNMDMKIANIAADIVVNLMEIKAGLIPPPGVIIRPEYEGWHFEAVYDDIYQEEKRNREEQQKAGGQGQSSSGQEEAPDPGKCGGFTTPKNNLGQDMDQAEINQMKGEITASVIANAHATKDAGMLPGYLRDMIKEIRQPEVPWQSIMEKFMTNNSRSDYSWEEPDEEYLQRGLFIPSLSSKVLGEIILVGDASGSIPDWLFQQFTNEGQEMLDRLQPDVLRMIWFANTVETDHEYRPGDRVDPGRRSSGGTAFQPVFDYIEEKGYQPACVVIMTDMNSVDTPRDPGYPVLWVSYGRNNAPFGELVKIGR